MNDETLPNSSETISESDLKKAFHTLLLYMGEIGQESLDSNVFIPFGEQNLQVSFEVNINDIQEV